MVHRRDRDPTDRLVCSEPNFAWAALSKVEIGESVESAVTSSKLSRSRGVFSLRGGQGSDNSFLDQKRTSLPTRQGS